MSYVDKNTFYYNIMCVMINFNLDITTKIHNTSGLNKIVYFCYIKEIWRYTIITGIGFSEDIVDPGFYFTVFHLQW